MTTLKPEIHSLVDLTHDGVEYLSRVEDFEGPTVWIAAPLGGTVEPPAPGSPLSLRWSAGVRGRYVAAVRLRSTRPSPHLWNLSLDGTPAVDQRRQYTRGGGGEPIQLRSMRAQVSGQVTDLGEGGLRCRFPEADLRTGEPVEVAVTLDAESLAVDGWVLRADDNPTSHLVDVTVTFNLTERDAEMVRRYVIRRQILARRTAADAAS